MAYGTSPICIIIQIFPIHNNKYYRSAFYINIEAYNNIRSNIMLALIYNQTVEAAVDSDLQEASIECSPFYNSLDDFY